MEVGNRTFDQLLYSLPHSLYPKPYTEAPVSRGFPKCVPFWGPDKKYYRVSGSTPVSGSYQVKEILQEEPQTYNPRGSRSLAPFQQRPRCDAADRERVPAAPASCWNLSLQSHPPFINSPPARPTYIGYSQYLTMIYHNGNIQFCWRWGFNTRGRGLLSEQMITTSPTSSPNGGVCMDNGPKKA